jgi:predicted DNA-binding transcriptional regulator YafY
MDGYFLPPLTFTSTEAAVLALGGSFVRERVGEELRGPADEALAKLEAALPPDRRAALERWRSEMVFIGRSHSDDPRWSELRRAVEERRVIRLLYQGARQAESEWREVEPTTLIHLNDRWNVAGYCRARQAPRFFRFDRIDELRVTGERFELGERHALPPREPGQRLGSGEARVRFDASVERRVRERQLFTLLREEPDPAGPVFVYAILDAEILRRWLLGWGTAVTVLDPPELRGALAEEATKVAERHKAPDRQLSGARA